MKIHIVDQAEDDLVEGYNFNTFKTLSNPFSGIAFFQISLHCPLKKIVRVFGFFKDLSYFVRQLPIMAMQIMVNNQVPVFIQLVLTIGVFHVDMIAGVILVR
ncbi:MAG: hypothetical protein JRD93_13010 [Deltaproteobacteria bacterium]|nr:hypothetical protein [Deltaproteobacteria bacterium]